MNMKIVDTIKRHNKLAIGFLGSIIFLGATLYFSNNFKRQLEIVDTKEEKSGVVEEKQQEKNPEQGDLKNDHDSVVENSNSKGKKDMTFEEVKAYYKANTAISDLDDETIEEHAALATKIDSRGKTEESSNLGAIFEEYGETWAPSMIPSRRKGLSESRQNKIDVDNKQFWVQLLADRSLPGFTTKEEAEDRVPIRNFNLQQLSLFDGEDGKPIYIALKRDVFDVSRARAFYGSNAKYNFLAGHDASISLAKLKYGVEYLDNFDSGVQLSKKEKRELENWYKSYKDYKEYPLIGKLVTPPQPRQISLEELNQMNGKQSIPEGYAAAPMCIGINGNIYDVSFGGAPFYQEGASYNIFVGKDVSRALAKLSFSDDDIGNPNLDDLTEKERQTLNDWELTFRDKKLYPIVGTYKMK